MEIVEPEKELILKLNEIELRYIREFTQNYMGELSLESPEENEIRLNLFVVCSRALGYCMDAQGKIINKKENK